MRVMRVRMVRAALLLCLLAIACRPFSERQVSIEVSDEVTLAGTLSLPDGESPSPAVILISGSGWQTRDSNLGGFKVYAEIARHLSANGIAVLRCDDRGVGRSTGDPSGNANTTLDFADDVFAQVAHLKTLPEVDPEKIGLFGLSEGAVVASMVDARSDDIAFAILVAAPALPIKEVLTGQLEASLRLKGLNDSSVAARLDLWRRIYDAVEGDEDTEGLRAELREALRDDVALETPEERERIGDPHRYAANIVETEFRVVLSKWGRFLVAYDPRPDQAKMDSRVLALYGGKDSQVIAGPNAAALDDTFRTAGKTDYAIRILPDANHLFQRAVTGAAAEYADLPGEFVPGYLESITAWALDGSVTPERPGP